MGSEFTRKLVLKFLPAQFSWIWLRCLQGNFIIPNTFQSDRMLRVCSQKFTAHYAFRNADLNLKTVAGTTNRFFLHIHNSWMEPTGVRLTWLDFKIGCTRQREAREEGKKGAPERTLLFSPNRPLLARPSRSPTQLFLSRHATLLPKRSVSVITISISLNRVLGVDKLFSPSAGFCTGNGI